MGLRDLLKKKDKSEADGPAGSSAADSVDEPKEEVLSPPDFTFIRSDTYGAEVIHPPSEPAAPKQPAEPESEGRLSAKDAGRRSFFGSSRHRDSSAGSGSGRSGGGGDDKKEKGLRRLSQRLHLSRSPPSSDNVPQDLPEIVVAGADDDAAGVESQWEKRATILAHENERNRSRPASPVDGGSERRGRGRSGGEADLSGGMGRMVLGDKDGAAAGARKRSASVVSSKAIDDDIQEAIRLHEAGDLEKSTVLFGRLADPQGANNPLSQVLYGLALRHGWGCEVDPEGAVHYLSKAAANAATVESLALQAGMKKGGAAKGELVLAIFELANCFRHGWGVPKDAVAAKQYYETAANLGDTDAMNEAAWCYLEGFGCKKDKFAAAKYYRLAEQNGNKTLGNSWIWKEKYDPGKAGKK